MPLFEIIISARRVLMRRGLSFHLEEQVFPLDRGTNQTVPSNPHKYFQHQQISQGRTYVKKFDLLPEKVFHLLCLGGLKSEHESIK